MTRTPSSRSRTAAHRPLAPPPRGGRHPRGRGTTWRPGQAAADVAAELRAATPIRSALARLLGLRTRERAWRVGAAGERITARHLRRLTDPWWARLTDRPTRWDVLHAVPVGDQGADIDHVVLGPAGVATVNTKHHPGATVWAGDHVVTVNGARHPTPATP
ncbi:nuclease-related domain-containing protein [Pseudonocardia sp. H11422]|uniref:nuclease-related domain-containing protein n=1 Tax=Pseudonocardia sp. H11422 TaxID=2835866 RepID=UPI001BDC89F9|nr:nuclease-related domain-containing protein [Pseudonocardia sp. H11422]